MAERLELRIVTPVEIAFEGEAELVAGEDATGRFAVLPRHEDFLTVLTVSVLRWRTPDGAEHYAAVRGGVFEVSGGRRVQLATPEAVLSDRLEELWPRVVERMRRQAEEMAAERTAMARLELAVVRSLRDYLRARRTPPARGGPGPVAGGGAP